MQTNELQRAQKQVTELQNTLSILENEYTNTMNNIVDMAMQKMKSVTEKDDEKANYVSGTLCRLVCLS
jgi:conjugal transfer/entry exclusion protein